MEERKQFTFYESFFKALKRIKNKSVRADAYDAICAYALNGEMPDLEKANDAVASTFELVKPVLDSARKKASSGKHGGSKPKANASKPEAKPREKEIEKEIEKEAEEELENDTEKESYSFTAGGGDCAGDGAAHEAMLAEIGLKPGEYPRVTVNRVQQVKALTARLHRKYCFNAPTALDCRQVFELTPSPQNDELLDYAFQKAAIAGKAGDWRYIRGIMGRLSARDITTAEEARSWDEERPDIAGGSRHDW